MAAWSARDPRAVAEVLVTALTNAQPLPLISSEHPDFDLDDAYKVLDEIAAIRRAQGWVPVGRKIGFTNRTIWELYNVDAPFWATVWKQTLTLAASDAATLPLGMWLEPRIEPEVAFKLRGRVPITDDPEEVLASVEWMAPAFEIVQSLFPSWRFTLADATAAFGLHGRLVVGSPVAVTDANRRRLAEALVTFETTLARDGEVVDRGSGSNVLGSPALALVHLAAVLADRDEQPQLATGEVVTTGTITNAWPVSRDESWTSDYGTLGLDPLRLTFS